MTTNTFNEKLLKNLDTYLSIIKNDKYFSNISNNIQSINYELEFVYFNNNNIIDEESFKNIILFLKSENEFINIKELAISSYNNYKSLSDIRVIIDSNENIKKFSQNEKEYLEKKQNIIYEQKSDLTQKIKKLVLNDFKLNLKLEKQLKLDNKEDKTLIKRFNDFYDIENIKTYRYKNRYRFKYDYFYIDMTIVKTLDNYDMKSKSFQETSYEFELEIDTKKLFSKFYKDGIFIDDLNIEYKTFINNIACKLSIINNLICKNLYYLDEEVKKEIKKDYKILVDNKFLGPKPISLTYKDLKDIYQDNKKMYEYKFTDKADGERYNLFINKNGNIYLINNNLNILNLDRNINNISYHNTVIDGELIKNYPTDNLNVFDDDLDINLLKQIKIKEYVFSFRAFDIYILNEKKLYLNDENHTDHTPLNLNQRYTHLNNIINILKNKYIDKSCNDKITFDIKEYEDLENLNNNFKKKDYIKKDYNLDGLILMPNINIPKNSINNIWRANLKWKPKILNTIDFKIKIFENGDKTEFHLYSYLYSSNNKIEVHFQSIQPYIKNIHIVPVESNYQKTEIDKNIIKNNQIVECIYVPDKNKGKWKFLRIREDKTNPNPMDVANKTFFNIFNTFKFDDIKNIETVAFKYNNFINNNNYYDNNDNNNLYANDYSSLYRRYNNHIKNLLIDKNIPIKNNINILDIGCGRGGDINKFMNTINNKKDISLNLYLGIDKDNNNITGVDKARERFINLSSKNAYKKFNSTFNFITGDVNNLVYDSTDTVDILKKLIVNGDQYTDDKDFIHNILNNDAIFDKKIIDECIKNDTKFDFINCQFMIHYLNDLNIFFKSVSNLLNKNGIFIATYIDFTNLEKLMNNTHIEPNKLKKITNDFEKLQLPNFTSIEEKNIYSDDFQDIVKYNNKLYVRLNSTDTFIEEKSIYTNNLINIIEQTNSFDLITSDCFNKLILDNSKYKKLINNMGHINKFIVLKKKYNNTISSVKTQLEFIDFILNS